MTSRRSLIVALLAACMAIGSAGPAMASSGSRTKSGAPKLNTSNPFRIASPEDETGSGASVGQQFSAGLNVAVKDVNNAGGILGRKVEVTYEDTQGDPVKASQVTASMLSTGDYQAIIPTALSPTETPAIVEQIKRAGVLSITPNVGTAVGDPSAFPTIFGPQFPDNLTGEAVGCQIASFKPKRIAILAITGAYPDGLIQNVKAEAKKIGAKVVAEERYEFTATNITAQVQQILAAKPQVIYLSAYYGAVTTALQALSDLGADNIQVVGDDETVEAPPSTFLPKGLAIPAGMAGTAWAINTYAGDTPNPAVQPFVKQVEAELGGPLPVALNTFLFPYDALQLMKWAADNAKSTSTSKMVAELETLSSKPNAKPGTLITANPGYSKKEPYGHLYSAGNAQFYSVEFAGKVINGTFKRIANVTPPCS